MEHWYYRIELSEGTFTSGKPQWTLALCRPFFQRVEKTGLRCLDIGTQEFVAPVLFHRQGAGEIVAADILELEEHRRAVVAAYGAKFHYAGGVPLLRLKEYLREKNISCVFDFVNFCGVLYHLPDPLTGLMMARSFLRVGGLMILETSFAIDAGYIALVNHHGRLYPGSNYFQVSLGALDYWARMLRMQIIDAAFTAPANGIARVVMVLRGVEKPLAEPGDTWMQKEFVERDLATYGVNFAELRSAAPPVVYRGTPRGVSHPGLNSLNLYETFRQTEPVTLNPAFCSLRLSDAA